MSKHKPSRSLKQLSKVSVPCLSQEYFSAIFLQIIIKGSVAEFIFIKIQCFQHIPQNTFRRMRLMYENYFLRRILFETFQTTFTLCKILIAKTFDEITIKMKASSPILGNKEQKLLFLVVSELDLPIEIDFAPVFFACPIRVQIKLRAQIIGRVEVNLSSPGLLMTLHTFVFIQITSLVKPVYIFMVKSRAS